MPGTHYPDLDALEHAHAVKYNLPLPGEAHGPGAAPDAYGADVDADAGHRRRRLTDFAALTHITNHDIDLHESEPAFGDHWVRCTLMHIALPLAESSAICKKVAAMCLGIYSTMRCSQRSHCTYCVPAVVLPSSTGRALLAGAVLPWTRHQ